MPTNDAQPLTAEEIAELRDFLLYARGIVDFKVRETPLERFDRLVAERETLREDLDRIRSRCPACGGSGTHESIALAHHPTCDGTCGALCPVPQLVRVRCDCIGAIERLLGDVAGVRDALE